MRHMCEMVYSYGCDVPSCCCHHGHMHAAGALGTGEHLYEEPITYCSASEHVSCKAPYLRDGQRWRRKAGGSHRLRQQRGVDDKGDWRGRARQQRGRHRNERQARRCSCDCGHRRLWERRLPRCRVEGLLHGRHLFVIACKRSALPVMLFACSLACKLAD